MIQKLNNISFKQLYMFPTIAAVSPENKPKVNTAIKMVGDFCYQNDVFLGSDEKGELIIQVQKSNPLVHLLDPEVANKIDLDPKDLLAMINIATSFQLQHMMVHNEKPQVVVEKTKGINHMDDSEVALKIKETIEAFNKKYQEPLN